MKKKFNVFISDDDFDPEENLAACVYGPPITFFFKCKKCGEEWTSFMTVKKCCPKCGTECTDFTSDDDRDDILNSLT